MNRLTHGLYQRKINRFESLFGLHDGQMRDNRVVHNGGWYNQYGEQLGWGDMNREDFLKITSELEDDEMFIILRERAFEKGKQVSGSGNPGVDFIAAECSYILKKRVIYEVQLRPSDSVHIEKSGEIAVVCVARSDVLSLFKESIPIFG